MTQKQKKPALLQKGEPAPFSVMRPKGKKTAPGIIIVDHAANRVPRALQKTLGVARADLARHIGWDIGARDAALHIAKKLGMPAVVARYSRLVVDLNRDPEGEEVIPSQSDRTPVPGNRKLSKAARKRRLDALFWPYQDAIGREVDRALAAGQVPIILSIHSFTPVMDGFRRPWDIGVLWNRDKKSGQGLIRNLRAQNPQYRVGDNQPYTLKDGFSGHTIWRHAERHGLPHVFVEFRQDLIDTPAKARKWAGIFLKALAPVLADKATFKKRKI